MTEDRAYALAEEFGLDVGEVDEEIKEVLGLTKAEGVVVFGVIGSSPADRAGIKVKAVIKEVDGKDIRTMLDLGTSARKSDADSKISRWRRLNRPVSMTRASVAG